MVPIKDANAKCTLCGNQATGQWTGQGGDINVCSECATEFLPRLIADATLGEAPNDEIPMRGHHILETVQKNFWYATTCIAMKTRDERLKR